MKRARALPADYDPVYPYGQHVPAAQPPYINTNQGLTQSPPGTLAVHIDPPLTFGNDGAIDLATGPGLSIQQGKLQVKLGPGLATTSEGEIIVEDAFNSLTFQPPLNKNESDEVSLNLGTGLQESNGALNVVFPAPLTFQSPLQKNNDTVSLNLGSGLQESNGTLSVTFPSPLQFNLPLSLSNNQVSLQVGAGLQVDNGSLAAQPLTVSEPLQKTDQTISLNLGSGLTVNQGQLQVLPTTYAAPLSLNNNTVSLQVGDGLSIQGNALINTNPTQLFFSAPLQLDSNTVSLQLGGGLQVANGSMTVQTGPGVKIQSNAVTLSLGQGLKLISGALTAKLGNGLNIDNNGAVQVKLGSGLSMDNTGAVQLTTPATSPLVTLWTGPDPSVNGIVNGKPVIKCFICMTRIDSLVALTAKFVGVGDYEIVHNTQSPFSLTLEFNQFGQLITTGNINANSTWGEKSWSSNDVNPQPHQNWKLCMPNKAVYPENAGNVFWSHLGLDTVALDIPTNRNIDCLLLLNKPTTAIGDYALTFRFANFSKLSGGTLFKTDNVSFSYVGENP
ncbi:fiber [Mastadenovirus pipistrelli]|nr:fiber [Bat mastadenovirus B]